MREVYHNIGIIVINYYCKNGYDKTVELLLRSAFLINVFNDLYKIWINEDVPKIENIEQQKKELYWIETAKYMSDKAERIKGSIALYVLNLLIN